MDRSRRSKHINRLSCMWEYGASIHQESFRALQILSRELYIFIRTYTVGYDISSIIIYLKFCRNDRHYSILSVLYEIMCHRRYECIQRSRGPSRWMMLEFIDVCRLTDIFREYQILHHIIYHDWLGKFFFNKNTPQAGWRFA